MIEDVRYHLCTQPEDQCIDYDIWWEGLELVRHYCADFETTTDKEDCRVWGFAACDVRDPDHVDFGKDVSEFVAWCRVHAQCVVYFHNLAFDGSFIMDYLLKNGWLWVADRRDATDRTFTTVISDSNQVYCIDLYFTPAWHVKIFDSYKIVPLSIANMAKAYGLDESKGELDYAAEREVEHELTEAEKEYMAGDVIIAARVMAKFLDEGLTRMTAGSNALTDFKSVMGGDKVFRKWFPQLEAEEDDFVRKAYRGGFAYVNPRYAGIEVGEGRVYDVNSLYPSVMMCERLPYGRGVWFEGKPKTNSAYNLWVAMVSCSFRVREGHIPCVQLKHNMRYSQTEYLERSGGRVTFTTTSVDWGLITKQYHVYDVEWHGGYAYRSADFLFRKYVAKWNETKMEAGRAGNKGLRAIAKLMLNSLYGKFATRRIVYSRYPVVEDGVLRYRDLEPVEREGVYLPAGVFVTAYARRKTVSSAQANYDRFCYADTDSVHLAGDYPAEAIEVDEFELGKWKHESSFSNAKFLRAKCYIEQEKGRDGLTVHVAGMPARCHDQVTFENFGFGAVYDGKLYQKRVSGGIILEEGTMEIRR